MIVQNNKESNKYWNKLAKAIKLARVGRIKKKDIHNVVKHSNEPYSTRLKMIHAMARKYKIKL